MQAAHVFILLAGLVVGLGAVTVIDVHGFLARRSAYWTAATTRAHRVTKPLIWLGTGLYALGLWLCADALGVVPLQWLALAALVANGCFLSFVVSPFLLRRGEAELLPARWQAAVAASFLVSVAGWWGSAWLLAGQLAAISN